MGVAESAEEDLRGSHISGSWPPGTPASPRCLSAVLHDDRRPVDEVVVDQLGDVVGLTVVAPLDQRLSAFISACRRTDGCDRIGASADAWSEGPREPCDSP
jgi:hypothetical protein